MSAEPFRIPYKWVDFHAETKTYTVEASTAGLAPGRVPQFIQLYSDTGRTNWTWDFRFEKTARDPSGEDVQYWQYARLGASVTGETVLLKVWND